LIALLVFGLALLWALAARAAAEPGVRRFALFVGAPEGGEGTRPLRYAERDARRMQGILTRLGGVRGEDALLLLGAGADEVRRALADLAARAAAARASGAQTQLLVYYSGHSKDGELRLQKSRLPMAELRAILQSAPADVRIGLFDSCQSGAIARAKGARPAPAFDVERAREASAGPRGLVLIASSAADEESQESDSINASFFTHHLATGLLGAADASGDGKVTLAEAYAYAYGRTVGSTAGSAAGAQHPVYLYDLGGAGDVVLTEPFAGQGGLLFGPELQGVYVVLDQGRRAIAELAKPPGETRRLSLAPGSYTVKQRLEDGLLVSEARVDDRVVAVGELPFERRPLTDDPQKGAQETTWSLLATGGGQLFFDKAARDGLFPPTGLLGLELTVRGYLGHSLSWGLDLGLGGGDATLKIPQLDPTPMRFGEISGGASLLRDFEAGPLTLSVGGRVAFIYLARSFPNDSQLPAQSFFTLTPGAVAAAQLHLGDSWSLLLRARLNYLFYNVDHDQSLGYAELSLGVAYAFGQ
jgi:hypothetical protein